MKTYCFVLAMANAATAGAISFIWALGYSEPAPVIILNVAAICICWARIIRGD